MINLALIAAVAKNRVIGKDGNVPWYISEDLRRFRDITLNHSVIMGRVTFESIFNKLGKPLPKRNNIVLSRKDYRDPSKSDSVVVCGSLSEAIEIARLQSLEGRGFVSGDSLAYVIGGGEVYKQSIEVEETNRLELTELNSEHEGDIFFPKFSLYEWRIEKSLIKEDYSFVSYVRRGQEKSL